MALSSQPLPIISASTIRGSPTTPLHCCVPTLPVDLGNSIVFAYQQYIMDWLLLPGQCQYNRCTHHVNSTGSGRFCFTHGWRCLCSHAFCLNFAQAGGRCIKHGYKKPTCSVDGCSNQSVAHGLCKRLGACFCYNVINCTSHVFRQNMCQFHYSLTNVTSRVMNKSIRGRLNVHCHRS